MKEKLRKLPAPIQQQIFFRALIGCGFLLITLLIAILGFDMYLLLPGFGFAIFTFINGLLLFHNTSLGKYVAICGKCTEVDRTAIFKRIKSVIIQTDQHTVRVQLKQRKRSFRQGAPLKIYVSCTTPVYEKDGIQLLYDYIAIEAVAVAAKCNTAND